jgi:hypothetical protein
MLRRACRQRRKEPSSGQVSTSPPKRSFEVCGFILSKGCGIMKFHYSMGESGVKGKKKQHLNEF